MSDYKQLVNKAQRQIADKEKQRQEQQKQNNGFHINRNILAIVMIVAVAVVDAYLLLPRLSDNQIESDLELFVKEADSSIKKFLKDTGKLPPQIPEPGLRSFIEYRVINAQINPPEYVLKGKVRDVEHTWNSLGKKS